MFSSFLCNFCFTDVTVGHNLYLTNCFHIYCRDCVSTSNKYENKSHLLSLINQIKPLLKKLMGHATYAGRIARLKL